MPTGELGIAYFNPPYFTPFDRPWLDGGYFETGTAHPTNWEPADNTIVLDNLAGGNILQLLYTGSKAPSLQQGYPFDMHWLVAVQADFERLVAAKARGTPVQFCIGCRVCDSFLAISGQSYTLSRPVANGVVTGVTDLAYPQRIVLNGVDTPSAGSVSAQTFTAAATGVIDVHYTPLHYVLVRKLAYNMLDENKMEITARLEEFISGSFDD